MKKISRVAYEKCDVVLDGYHYDHCTFKSCTFVFAGVGVFGLTDNNISKDCEFRFDGAAANTLGAMQAIYSAGPWGRRTIIRTFKQIAPNLKKLH